MILPRNFYSEDAVSVAIELLGKTLHIRTTDEEFCARIVETEAYLGVLDPASHIFGDRKTERTKSIYMGGGHSYVYFIYGMYNCLNLTAGTTDYPEAVLLRGLEPLPSPAHVKKKDLKTNGPGKLCKFYHITRAHDGLRLWKKDSALYVTDDGFHIPEKQISHRPRVGVDYAGEAASWPLRFYIAGNPYVSKK